MHDQPALERRALLKTTMAAGAGALALSLGRPGVALAAPQGGIDSTPAADSVDAISPQQGPTFFADAQLNFQMLGALIGLPYKSAELGEMLRLVAVVQGRGSTYVAFYEEMMELGRRLGRHAQDARRHGRLATTREYSLRASNAYAQALFFALAKDPTGRLEAPAYRLTTKYWNLATSLLEPAAVPLRIPYGRSYLPAWLLRPAGPVRRRPTVIFNNGSDAENIDMYGGGAAAAVERGYNALVFEGPGQGSMLFLRDLPFRPDWEKVVTPIVTALRARRDVDPKRIAIWGWSMGGELVARAAAFEPRLAAVVADPGAIAYVSSWPAAVIATGYDGDKATVDRGFADLLAGAPPNLQFTLRKRVEIFKEKSWYDLVRTMAKFDVNDLIGRIESPMLVTEPEYEAFWPGDARKVYDKLKSRPRKLVNFTAAQGAQFHCEPMAPQVRSAAVLDWLSGPLGG